jgi:hypothetical protein
MALAAAHLPAKNSLLLVSAHRLPTLCRELGASLTTRNSLSISKETQYAAISLELDAKIPSTSKV